MVWEEGWEGNEVPHFSDKAEWLRVSKIITDMKAAEESQDTVIGQQNDRVN